MERIQFIGSGDGFYWLEDVQISSIFPKEEKEYRVYF